MSNASTEYPDLNTVYPVPAPTPQAPAPSEYPTLEEAYGGSQTVGVPVHSNDPMGASASIAGLKNAENIDPGLYSNTDPIEQRLVENTMKAYSGINAGSGLAQLAQAAGSGTANIGNKIASLFEAPESLKSAGITSSVLEHMAPGGQNPADYVDAVEKQLSNNGALATTAKETWDNMSKLANSAGQAISQAKDAIRQASPDALMVDANKILDPIANEALKRGTGLFSKTENLANPFYDAFDGLQKIAQQQGGKLTIDNLDSALQETGERMNEGGDAVQTVFSKLYGKLADARDSIVNNVAEQSGNPAIKDALLRNNADYSTYMRLLPGIGKSAAKEAIKEGISAYQKYGGPTILKYGASGATALTGEHLIEKLYHMLSGGHD